MTKLMQCDCDHKYQDEKYGKRIRVHNQAISKSPGVPSWTCTVCGKKK